MTGDIIDAMSGAGPIGRIIGALMLAVAALLMLGCIYAAVLLGDRPRDDEGDDG